MQVHKGRARVVAYFDDGAVIERQGMVFIRERRTEAEVEFTDGKRKAYPLESVEFMVLEKDIAHEVMEGTRTP